MAVIVSRGIRVPNLVDYIYQLQSDGNAYIDTKYYPNFNTKVVAKFQSAYGSNTNYSSVFGCQTAWANNGFSFGTYTVCFGTAATTTAFNYAGGQYHVVELSSEGLYVDGEKKSSFATNAFQTVYPMYLFGNNEANTTLYPSMATIQYFQIYENDVLIRDFWPCFDPDGVACMYDNVERKYYYNAGSGEFIAGEAA